MYWIWDQSLMTVEINTITRVKAQLVQSSIRKTAYGSPRSIVTDHYPWTPDLWAQAHKLGWWEGGPVGHKHKKIKKEVDRRNQPDSMGFYNN